MPRAEAGSLKHLSNSLKSKGLQRLRWYCQVCEKQCRDQNGFSCHVQSESHVRRLQEVGSNSKTFIDGYSNDFQRDFLSLLRTGHGTKSVHLNQFYNTFIADKSHIHMNATKWKSLTEFAKHLGREGICKVEETDKGLHISWIDRSPEALRRQEAVRQKERQQQGDQKLEEKMIQQQVERAQIAAAAAAAAAAKAKEDLSEEKSDPLKEGEKMTINFEWKGNNNTFSSTGGTGGTDGTESTAGGKAPPSETSPAVKSTMKLSFGGASSVGVSNGLKPKNGLKKSNALSSKKTPAAAPIEPNRKLTEAERIMRVEMDAERKRKERGFGDRESKRLKV